jgi:hypothetical protein
MVLENFTPFPTSSSELIFAYSTKCNKLQRTFVLQLLRWDPFLWWDGQIVTAFPSLRYSVIPHEECGDDLMKPASLLNVETHSPIICYWSCIYFQISHGFSSGVVVV